MPNIALAKPLYGVAVAQTVPIAPLLVPPRTVTNGISIAILAQQQTTVANAQCVVEAAPAPIETQTLRPWAANYDPAEWQWSYGIPYRRPGVSTANPDMFYDSVAHLGVMLPTFRRSDAVAFSGWVATVLANGSLRVRVPVHGAIDAGRASWARSISAVWPEVGIGNSFPIYSPAAGVVERVLWNDSSGNAVVLRHTSPHSITIPPSTANENITFWSMYGHLRNGGLNDLNAFGAIGTADQSRLDIASAAVRMSQELSRLIGAPSSNPERYVQLVEDWGRESDTIRVRIGDSVAPGQLIAYAGGTGVNSGLGWTGSGSVDPTVDDLVPNIHLHQVFAVTSQVRGSPVPMPIAIDAYGVYQQAVSENITTPDQMRAAQDASAARFGDPERRGSAIFDRYYNQFGAVSNPQRLWFDDNNPPGAIPGPDVTHPRSIPPRSRRIRLDNPGLLPPGRFEVLRQHDPIFSAERARVWLSTTTDGGPSSRDDCASLSSPFYERPVGAIRMNDPWRRGPLTAAFRTVSRSGELPVVCLHRAGDTARLRRLRQRARRCDAFQCLEDGQYVELPHAPCFSPPDIAVSPTTAAQSGMEVIVYATLPYRDVPGVSGRRFSIATVQRSTDALTNTPWISTLVRVRDPLSGLVTVATASAERPMMRMCYQALHRRWVLAWVDPVGSLRIAVRSDADLRLGDQEPLRPWHEVLRPPPVPGAFGAHPLVLADVRAFDMAAAPTEAGVAPRANGPAPLLLAAREGSGTTRIVGFDVNRFFVATLFHPGLPAPPAQNVAELRRHAAPVALTLNAMPSMPDDNIYVTYKANGTARNGYVIAAQGRDGGIALVRRDHLTGTWQGLQPPNQAETRDLVPTASVAYWRRTGTAIEPDLQVIGWVSR